LHYSLMLLGSYSKSLPFSRVTRFMKSFLEVILLRYTYHSLLGELTTQNFSEFQGDKYVLLSIKYSTATVSLEKDIFARLLKFNAIFRLPAEIHRRLDPLFAPRQLRRINTDFHHLESKSYRQTPPNPRNFLCIPDY